MSTNTKQFCKCGWLLPTQESIVITVEFTDEKYTREDYTVFVGLVCPSCGTAFKATEFKLLHLN